MKREKIIYAKNEISKFTKLHYTINYIKAKKINLCESMCTLGVCYKANFMYCYFCLIHATECWIFSFHSKTYKKHAIYLLFFILFLLLLLSLLLLLLLCLLADSSSSSLFLTNTHTLSHSHKQLAKRTNENYDIRNVVHSKFVMKM